MAVAARRRNEGEALAAFWPASEAHRVEYVDLDLELSDDLNSLAPQLFDLALLSDAYRSLETSSASVVSQAAAGPIRSEMAARLCAIAATVDADSAAGLMIRAEMLEGGIQHAEAARKLARSNGSRPLEVICGPLCTWRRKSSRPFHSFLAAGRHNRSEALLATLDASLASAVADLSHDLGEPSLSIEKVNAFCAMDLIASGGEANFHPKHFAYFLPEDEGVDGVPLGSQRTILLRNVYLSRYRAITEPLARQALRGPLEPTEIDAEAALLAWALGHDLGHGVRLPDTASAYSWKDRLGIEPFMMLQEAIADVIGFLLVTTDTWSTNVRLAPSEACAVFLGEALHYLRRGPWHDGDAGAAYLELNYLAARGHIEISEDGEICWDAQGVREGILQLASSLVSAVVRARDERPSQQLIAEFGWGADSRITDVLAKVRQEMSNVPTTIAYRLEPQAGSGDSPMPTSSQVSEAAR